MIFTQTHLSGWFDERIYNCKNCSRVVLTRTLTLLQIWNRNLRRWSFKADHWCLNIHLDNFVFHSRIRLPRLESWCRHRASVDRTRRFLWNCLVQLNRLGPNVGSRGTRLRRRLLLLRPRDCPHVWGRAQQGGQSSKQCLSQRPRLSHESTSHQRLQNYYGVSILGTVPLAKSRPIWRLKLLIKDCKN